MRLAAKNVLRIIVVFLISLQSPTGREFRTPNLGWTSAAVVVVAIYLQTLCLIHNMFFTAERSLIWDAHADDGHV